MACFVLQPTALHEPSVVIRHRKVRLASRLGLRIADASVEGALALKLSVFG